MERQKKSRQHKKLYDNFHYIEIKAKKMTLSDDNVMPKSDKKKVDVKIVITKSCTKCGKLCEDNVHECAAKNATCKKCKKRGHFARVCYSFSGRREDDDQSNSVPVLSERKFNTNNDVKPKNNSGNLKNNNNSSKNGNKVLVNKDDKAKLKENLENNENIVEENKADKKAARIAEMRKKAAELYKKKQFKSALQLYSKIIDECPDNEPEIYFANRAACHMTTNDYKKALIDAKKSIEINPKFIKGHMRTVKCTMALGKFIEVELAINALTELDPSNEDLKIEKKKLSDAQNELKLFDNYFLDANYELAIKSLDKILKTSSHSVFYKIKKSECLVKLGKHSDAEVLVKAILAVDEFNIDAKFILSLCLYQYDADNAVKTLKEILRVVPDHEKALEVYKKAKVLAAKKREGTEAFKSKYYTKAHKLYTEALRADPDNLGMAKRLYCNLAYASARRGNLEISTEEATSALRIDPDYVKMLVHRGQLYMEADEFDLAVKDFSRAHRLEPNEFEIYGMMQHAKHMQFFSSLGKKKYNANPSYYEILGVAQGASGEVLKKAYREKAMEHHPDRHSHCSDIEKKKHEQKFQEITRAYRHLTNGSGGGGSGGGGGGFENMHDFMNEFCREFFEHMFG